MTGEERFETDYASLNEKQRQAVDAIEGPVLVVAGPGTGKTKILTLRLANIVRRTDTDPENILALTFTEAAAAEIKKRLVSIIGQRGYRVPVMTFHAFGNKVIQENPESFPHIMDSRAATDVDCVAALEEIFTDLASGPLKSSISSPFTYLADSKQAISILKRENVSPAEFSLIVAHEKEALAQREDAYHVKGAHKGKKKTEVLDAEKELEKLTVFASVYATYEEKLRTKKLYDFDDMIRDVARAMEDNENLLRSLQEMYQYVLVDEHQDTNNSQNRILELLCNFHDTPNIFVVGDEKQSIFRFQGASLQNFSYFQALYKNALKIVLENNYRSTPTIVKAAEYVVPGEKPLVAASPSKDAPIRVLAFSGDEEEEFCVAREIKKKISSGMDPSRIAILARTNADAQDFYRSLGRAGIPAFLDGDADVLEQRDIFMFLKVCRAVADFGNAGFFAQALHAPFLRIPPLDIFKVLRRARERNSEESKAKSLLDIVRSKPLLDSLDLENAERLHDVYRLFSGWAAHRADESLTELFSRIIRESGFLEHIQGSAAMTQKLDALSVVFDEVKKMAASDRNAGLGEFFDYLDTLERHGVRIKTAMSPSALAGRVRVMTAHKAKGLEFEEVYIVRAFEGKWGSRRGGRAKIKLPERIYSLDDSQLGNYSDEEDEKRLFYVALTRAKRHATITYARVADDGKERIISQLAAQIVPELLLPEEDAASMVSQMEQEFSADRGDIFAPVSEGAPAANDAEFIWNLFLAHGGLSVTHLNNYLKCPWRWFYVSLLRVPQSQEGHQLYGIAVHSALKDLFDAARDRETTKDFLLEKFRHYLIRQPLSERELEEYTQKGIDDLAGWYDFWSPTWNYSTMTELSIREVHLEDIPLNGVIDKAEFVSPGKVNVVDYKTGAPKSRAEIEGDTKNSDGGIKRQLIFYKLLLALHKGGEFGMESAEVDFVAPLKNGLYRKEKFEILDHEVVELENEIRRVAQEIRALSFWNSRCEGEFVAGRTKKCEWCSLRDAMG